MYQLEEHDREIQEAKRQAAKLPQIAARLFIAEQRTKQLEELCRDLWLFSCITGSGGAEKAFEQRMNALGLLEDEQND